MIHTKSLKKIITPNPPEAIGHKIPDNCLREEHSSSSITSMLQIPILKRSFLRS